MTEIICFGIGKILDDFMKCYNKAEVNVVAFCDNDKNKWGNTINNILVISPNSLTDVNENIKIVITTKHYEDIKLQLIEMGINEDRIICFGHFHNYYLDKELLRGRDLLAKETPYIVNHKMVDSIINICMSDEKNLFLNAKNLIWNMPKKINSLEEVEFQVFSQFGEDGIIQWLIKNVKVFNHTFVEFGVEDYVESNTRFLLMNNNWSGLVIDGSKRNINCIKNSNYYWKYDLQAIDAFITKDNINNLISSNGITGNIGLLSVDIDGNDYWVLREISCIRPSILICEYNNIFGGNESVSIPYQEDFYRTNAHYSNLYWGASLKAFQDYAESIGYVFLGSNSAGHNAFFALKECIDEELIPKDISFKESKYRESRNQKGQLTFLRGIERIKEIKDMELYNLKNNKVEKIKQIYHLD